MSDNIPFDIQMDIMNRLPVKSLLQFRTVSKQWKFSIDNFEFIHENLAFRHMNSNLNIISFTPVASSEDPTLLKINYPLYGDGPWYVSVSTLSSRTLYNLDYDCLPRESIRIKRADMPEQILVGEFSPSYYISQLGDSLIISGSFDFGNFRIIYAWALEVKGSCSLLFTIPHLAGHYLKLLRFSKDNQPIVEATIFQQCFSTLQFLMFLRDDFEVLKVVENSLEVLKVLENNL
ncbi:F-box domain containing protein [Tanacetum coccineum]|uniref:F-box domain containing protein n=1 Tax=Tanacetum coccineum TaxID=301880 RepID=A0ABQ5CBV2_9ASTR